MPWLWEFHKLHHSIERLDGIGNFRFYWAEIVVYKTLSYLPLVIIGLEMPATGYSESRRMTLAR